MLPSRQDNGNIRAPARACIVSVVVSIFVVVVYGGGNFGCKGACLPAPLLDRLLVERMSGDLVESIHRLVHITALLLLLGLHSALQRPSELPLLTFNLGCPLFAGSFNSDLFRGCSLCCACFSGTVFCICGMSRC